MMRSVVIADAPVCSPAHAMNVPDERASFGERCVRAAGVPMWQKNGAAEAAPK